MVWADLDSKVFYLSGDRRFGKTRHGEYMLEADALAAGYRKAPKARAERQTTAALPN